MKTEEIKFGMNGIFPTPVYGSANIKQITKSELDFVEEQKKETKINTNKGNLTTVHSYVLEVPALKDLKNIIEQHLNTYLKEVICPVEQGIKIYITQSWLNYTGINQYHHEHSHDNSFLSGVFYFKADKKVDGIHFKKPPSPEILSIPYKKKNIYNTMDFGFNVDKGTLLIFPSKLVHYVGIKKDPNERISLSFNTFLKGSMGNSNEKTQLKL